MAESFFGKRIETLQEFFKAFPSEKKCLRFLEKKLWPNGPISPFDVSSKVYKRSDGQYRCKNTGRNFNVKTGTIFGRSKVPLMTWFLAMYHFEHSPKGIASTHLSKIVGVTQDTAWHMLVKCRKCCSYTDGKLEGEVELDETFVGGKNKNRHSKNKIKNARGRSHLDKEPVMGLLQRDPNGGGQKVICFQVKNTSWKPLTRHIITNVKRDVTLYMDEWSGYNVVQRIYKHSVVNHGHGIYVENGGAYTNTIEAFWSNYCKRAINGTYNSISKHHLQGYFDEFSFRYNTRKVSFVEKFMMLFDNIYHPETHKELEKGNGKKRKYTLGQIVRIQRAKKAAAQRKKEAA